MRLVVVSDAHLLGPEDPEQQAFCAWLRGLEADELVLLGDILHAGWSWAGQPHPRHAEVFVALEEVRTRGAEISLVPGNHDFGLRPEGIAVHGVHRRRCDGTGLLLAHGDEPDRTLGYRGLSAVLRGRPFGALVDALGHERGTALLDRLAGARHGPEVAAPEALVAAQRAWAADALEDPDLDGVIMGHSHVLGEVSLPGGTLWHTGAWLGLRSWLDVVDGTARLRQGVDSAP